MSSGSSVTILKSLASIEVPKFSPTFKHWANFNGVKEDLPGVELFLAVWDLVISM